ncbi:MAG: homoserine dehydrogenase [Planctomycetota bacterium]
MSTPIGVSLIGCGAVGSHVARMLLQQGDDLHQRTSCRFELRHILVRDPKRRRDAAIPNNLFATDSAQLLNDTGTNVILELAGGTDEARRLILAALQAGKDVVTANKALLALHGRDVFSAARQVGRCVAFEASVCGGVPLIESIRRGLIGNQIDAVMGILNGTSNYILTRMLENNASYAHALAEAQAAGYAEADPTLDVSGGDAAHKLAILASLAMRSACEFNRIQVEGIEKIELSDLTAGEQLGYRCKLLAVARRFDDGLDLSVQPTFIPTSHPLASVSGPFNAVSVYGTPIGHTFFYGRGAGGAATASAVIADLVDVAIGNARRTFESLVVLPDQTAPAVYRAPGETCCPHYIRVGLRDQPGGIGNLATVLGSHGISIATIVQHEPPQSISTVAVPVIVTTHPSKEGCMRDAVADIAKMDATLTPPICIPVLEERMD